MKLLLALLLAFPACLSAGADPDFLMGAVVKSDKWKMDRTRNTETFTGNVSFRNPRYTLRSGDAVYHRNEGVWDLGGTVYTLRTFEDSSQVEMNCDKARYLENDELAFLYGGRLPVRYKYSDPDGRILLGRSGAAQADNTAGLMVFNGDFSISTDNLDLFSALGVYDNNLGTFLLYDSTSAPEGLPAAIGKREGYDFAVNSENIKFFKDSRDIKFYNKVSGWVKDVPVKPAAKK